MKILALLPLALASLAAQAAEIGPCMGLEREPSMVLQAETFAQGAIQALIVDTEGEPVCCSTHLVILVNKGEKKECFAVSQKAGNGKNEFPLGFNGIDFDHRNAAYDPAKGLLLSVPVGKYDNASGETKPGGIVNVRINRAHGTKVRIEK